MVSLLFYIGDILRNKYGSFRNSVSFNKSEDTHDNNPTVFSIKPSFEPLLNAIKSKFYVYCYQCNDVKPGLIKVRCLSCKNEMSQLLKEPTCWDDVIKKSRIRGHCPNSDCCISDAEFYFICSHADIEVECVPLPLIKDNTDCSPCMSCDDRTSPVIVFTCSLNHLLCLLCFQQYCSFNLKNRSFIMSDIYGYTLLCPEKCPNSFIIEPHNFKILDSSDYEQYKQFAVEEATLKDGAIFCPNIDCGNAIYNDDAINTNMILCRKPLGCGFVFCRDCREEYHTGECLYSDDPLNYSDAKSLNLASLNFIKSQTKKCPNCNVNIEKLDGCMHMTCTRCQFDWCWLCCTAWGFSCQELHWFG